MKDQITGQIKTVSIRVNGPISLAETTTNGEVNPENLNRCFVIGIDESEEQTKLIHQRQRIKYTLDGHLTKRKLNKIREKHIDLNIYSPQRHAEFSILFRSYDTFIEQIDYC